MKFRRGATLDDRLKRLAESIEALVRKDEERLREEQRIAALRSEGARKLYATCSAFVSALNGLLRRPLVELAPPEFTPDTYRDASINLFQINIAGRLIQIEFWATDTTVSTEQYRIPYVLQGAVRCLDQESIDRAVIPEQLLFYCLEAGGPVWILFDPRTHRTSEFNQECLISLFERLV